MKIPLTQGTHVQLRTLQTLEFDLQSFKTSGSDVKNAKFHNNVIDEPIFKIPLDQVRNQQKMLTSSVNICK